MLVEGNKSCCHLGTAGTDREVHVPSAAPVSPIDPFRRSIEGAGRVVAGRPAPMVPAAGNRTFVLGDHLIG